MRAQRPGLPGQTSEKTGVRCLIFHSTVGQVCSAVSGMYVAHVTISPVRFGKSPRRNRERLQAGPSGKTCHCGLVHRCTSGFLSFGDRAARPRAGRDLIGTPVHRATPAMTCTCQRQPKLGTQRRPSGDDRVFSVRQVTSARRQGKVRGLCHSQPDAVQSLPVANMGHDDQNADAGGNQQGIEQH